MLQFDADKGGLLAFASTSIKNRLIDEGRKLERRAKTVSLYTEDEEVGKTSRRRKLLFLLIINNRNSGPVRRNRSAGGELTKFQIDFSSLEEISPKQKTGPLPLYIHGIRCIDTLNTGAAYLCITGFLRPIWQKNCMYQKNNRKAQALCCNPCSHTFRKLPGNRRIPAG